MKKCVRKVLENIYTSRFFARLRKNKIHAPMRVKVKIYGARNNIYIPKNNKIDKMTIKIYGNNSTIKVGKGNYFADLLLWMEDNESAIEIGSNCAFCGSTGISCIEGYKIIIGNDLLGSRNISIVNGDSHSIIDINGKRINPSVNLSIGDHVWIGKNVNIMKKGSIGSNTIIGANSLVTHDYSKINNIVIAGQPAKIIKENVSWDKKRIKLQN